MLVWMDLEMTGLDHTRDRIVEIATIVTDDQLRIIAEGPDLVIHADDELLAAMDPVVVEMHTKSGLLTAIRASTITMLPIPSACITASASPTVLLSPQTTGGRRTSVRSGLASV